MKITNVNRTTIVEYFGRLPPTFRDDPLVHDNLANLETDMKIWGVA